MLFWALTLLELQTLLEKLPAGARVPLGQSSLIALAKPPRRRQTGRAVLSVIQTAELWHYIFEMGKERGSDMGKERGSDMGKERGNDIGKEGMKWVNREGMKWVNREGMTWVKREGMTWVKRGNDMGKQRE